MAKLHEILAIEDDRKKTAERLISESIKTLEKDNLFKGSVKRTQMFAEDEATVADEHIKIETTVDQNLEYTLKEVANYWDVVFQKDLSNQLAKADIVLDDGTVLAQDIPATFLLGMEKKLNGLRNLLNHIPTLAPGIQWESDHEQGDGVFRARHDVETFKTSKDIDFRVVVEPTEHHPAQVKEVSIVKNVGKITTTKWSGMLTPVEKAARLSRLEQLIAAVKKARQRANESKTVDEKIGKKLTAFIMKGV